MAPNRILYYQTFSGLSAVLAQEPVLITHIHLSAIHFGKLKDDESYIHLNNTDPNDPLFDNMWIEISECARKGIKIVLMIGGAGGGFSELFSNFEICYPKLKSCILDHPSITGVDLDIEEDVEIEDVKMLIEMLDKDFGKQFIISMAPIQTDLQIDEPGYGGFSYKQLFNSPYGHRINYFNVQFYADFSIIPFKQIVENGYPANKIVLGMLSEQFSEARESMLRTISEIHTSYPDFGGVFNWELFNASPSATEWLRLILMS